MGTKYRLSVKTAALVALVFLLAGCAQFQTWEDSLQQPREWDGCALGGALIGAAVGGIAAYFTADQTGGDTNRDNVKAVYIPIFTIVGGGLGAVAGHYICDPIIPPPPPAPVVAAPAPKASTPIKMDPKHPLKIGEEYYPDASKRANEEGRCTVQVTVAADGRITNESIQTSSGFPRLDDACLKGVHGQRVIPATEDGKPVEKTVSIPIVWKLTGK